MPFDVKLDEAEHLIALLSFEASKKSEAFHLAITDRAVFLPRKKLFAVKDPTYCERVPLNRVIEASVEKLSPYFLWTLGLVMMLVGTVTTGLMMLPILKGERGELSGYPPAVAVIGLVIPFIARRRYGLSISIVDEVFRWKPPLLVDKASGSEVERFLSLAADAFRQAGVRLRDERDILLPASGAASKKRAYPLANVDGESAQNRGVPRACYQCGGPLRIGHWEDWNGFLFQCPHCGRTHGRHWNAFAIMLGSILLNALSFLFTMRWKLALPLLLGFVLLHAGLGIALNRNQLSETLELLLSGTAFLAPLAINAVLLLRHEVSLDSATATKHKIDGISPR